MKPVLITSLDFELYWGVCSSRSIDEYKDNILGGRKAIPELLELFKKHSVHTTWATVGFMFAENYDDLKRYLPQESLLPTYSDPELNSYDCLYKKACNKESEDYFFALPLIKLISGFEGQEIGSHTFSHLFCRDKGITKEQFDTDILSAVKIAEDKGFKLSSVVFPRNQYNPDLMGDLDPSVISAFRDEENDWIHEKIKIKPLLRALRLMDVYFPLTGQGGYFPKKEYGAWNFVGSRMYKPYYKPLAFLERLKIRRIKKQMLHAAKNGLVFHLWWHPHNIGVRTDFHLKQLEEIFSYYDELKEKYGMVSMNMQEAAEYFSNLD